MKINFIRRADYNKHNVEYRYSKELVKEGYDVTLYNLSSDKTFYFKNEDGINIYNIKANNYTYYFKIFRRLKNSEDNINIVSAQNMNFILPLLCKKPSWVNLLITGSVSNKFRKLKNFNLYLQNKFYTYSIANNKGLGSYIFKNNKVIEIPIGGEFLLHENEIHPIGANNIFLYIGTLSNRNFNIFIKGFIKATKNGEYNAKLKIIGRGTIEDEHNLKKITEYNTNIDFIGYIPINEAKKYFMEADFGISYIPIMEKYNYQPPTKTYEYLVNGLPVLGTSTATNKKLITNFENGLLIKDDAESVSNGIKKIIDEKNQFDRKRIYVKSRGLTWKYSVKNYLIPFIEKITLNENV